MSGRLDELSHGNARGVTAPALLGGLVEPEAARAQEGRRANAPGGNPVPLGDRLGLARRVSPPCDGRAGVR
jgi:hypothetical protein